MHRYDPIHDTYKDDPLPSTSSSSSAITTDTKNSTGTVEIQSKPPSTSTSTSTTTSTTTSASTSTSIGTGSMLNPGEPPTIKPAPRRSDIASLIDPVSPPPQQELQPQQEQSIDHSTVSEPKSRANSAEADDATETEGEDESKTSITPSVPTETVEDSNATSTKPAKKQRKTSKKTMGSTPAKSVTVLISARSRHLKKDDGQPFTRKDIQYAFLHALFDNKTKAFHDPYPDLKDRVKLYNDTEEDKKYDYLELEGNNKSGEERPKELLTFAQLYIKTIAHSSKCSKILRDRLINDYKTSIPTCMICVLVNVGRMNTTINFVPDMKSQLRTYHSIPVLQVNYEKQGNIGGGGSSGGPSGNSDKQLQDTPRLKSILKACCDDSSEPNHLSKLKTLEKVPKTNVVNLLFLLSNSEDTTLEDLLGCSFFDLFVNSKFDPHHRAKLLLWLVFNYLETDLSDEEIAKNPFGEKVEIAKEHESKSEANFDFDIDTEEEIQFGKTMLEERKLYLNDENFYNETKIESREKRRKLEEATNPGQTIFNVKGNKRAKIAAKESATLPATSATSKSSPDSESEEVSTTATSQNSKAKTKFKANPSHQIHGTRLAKTQKIEVQVTRYVPPPPPPPPVYRTDINCTRVRKVLNELQKNNYKRRQNQAMIKFTDKLITTPYTEIKDGRLRLKSYQGDYVEYSSKFYKVFKKLAEEKAREGEEDVRCDIDFKIAEDGSLERFDINI